MKYLIFLVLMNFKQTYSIICQVCDSTTDAECSRDFSSRIVRCPQGSRFCMTKIMSWYSQNTKLYSRSCADFCYSGIETQPGYSLTTKCCQDDNCNARCQDTDCNKSNRLFTQTSLNLSLVFSLLVFIIVF